MSSWMTSFWSQLSVTTLHEQWHHYFNPSLSVVQQWNSLLQNVPSDVPLDLLLAVIELALSQTEAEVRVKHAFIQTLLSLFQRYEIAIRLSDREWRQMTEWAAQGLENVLLPVLIRYLTTNQVTFLHVIALQWSFSFRYQGPLTFLETRVNPFILDVASLFQWYQLSATIYMEREQWHSAFIALQCALIVAAQRQMNAVSVYQRYLLVSCILYGKMKALPDPLHRSPLHRQWHQAASSFFNVFMEWNDEFRTSLNETVQIPSSTSESLIHYRSLITALNKHREFLLSIQLLSYAERACRTLEQIKVEQCLKTYRSMEWSLVCQKTALDKETVQQVLIEGQRQGRYYYEPNDTFMIAHCLPAQSQNQITWLKQITKMTETMQQCEQLKKELSLRRK